MTALIGEITRRLPDRWLTTTLGPGALWVLTAALAVHFGQTNALGVLGLAETVRDTGGMLADRPAEALVYGALAVAASVGASAAAHAAGAWVRRLWSGRWGFPFERLATRLTSARRERRSARLAGAGTRLPAAFLPSTATWIGDRLQLTDARITAQYGLALALVWPRIWQLVDVETRALVQQARARYDAASTLVGWSATYLVLAVVWWPALVPGALTLLAGWRRGRVAVALFCDTVESTVDLQHRALATALGHPLGDGKPLPPRIADAINDQLHKGATPQPHGDSGPTDRTR
ncbi:hypothetical protein BLA60_35090 [Actinophytocola xinjiangensis]|uniref:Uncharacterized protein n=1 Tax=Actinophytocola xinjiangensis TaxID=485602 RepID=A0A7Z0WG22_9PSEU|nr:hypothetical protein [Actinophytocola xinjiangensis]OLF05739.1 hypothetical protein BLA60_35090 [Actinophytocola xinjiangensis]